MAQQTRPAARPTAPPPPPPPPTPEVGEVPVAIASRSASIDQLARAFVQVQIKLQPIVKRNTATTNQYTTHFADLAAILDEAIPLLGEHKLGLAQFPSNDGAGHPMLRTYLMHESGQFISDEMWLLPARNDPQGQGSAITFARRYSACAILGIRTYDDDGLAGSNREGSVEPRHQATRQRPEPPKEQTPPPIEVELGWADPPSCKSAHDAVSGQIRALNLAPDHAFLAELKAYREEHGWPMTPDALTALSMMVAKVTSPAPQQAPPAPADGTPPAAPTPAPEAPSAQSGPSGESMPWDGLPPAGATPDNVCWYCEKQMLATQKTVIIGGQDADHPAQRMHESCYEERQAELESDSAEDAS